MIHIFYSTIDCFYNEQCFYDNLQKLPRELQNRNKRYIRKEDRYLNLLGKLLLIEGLNKLGYSSKLLEEVLYNNYGCPYFNENINFSISHSGMYAICAISDFTKIGIDIELYRKINFVDYRVAMNHSEWKIITESRDPYTLFFRFWTTKECFIKGLKKGMAIPLNQLDINFDEMSIKFNNEKWFIKHLPISTNYICTLASLVKIADEKINIHNCCSQF